MDRPEIKDFMPKANLQQVHEMYLKNPIMYGYINALDAYIDYLENEFKNNGGLGDIVGQSEQLCQCEDAPIKHFAKNWCDACQKHIV